MFISVNQYGEIKAHPKKPKIADLLERWCMVSASRMYIGRKDGVYHIGYVLTSRGYAPNWVTVYNAVPVESKTGK